MLKRCLIVTACAVSILSPHANAQSFDCHARLTAVEQTICDNDDLRALDSRMSRLYFKIANNVSRSKYRAIRQSQREWLRARDRCGRSAYCLRGMYIDRIREFREALEE